MGKSKDLATRTFNDDVAFDADTLYVDSTNDQVGIGTDSPAALVHVSTETAGGAGPVEVMRLEVKEASYGALDVGDGVKLSFYIPEGISTSQESAAVAGIRDSGSDSNGAGSLAFYTAGDDVALQQRMRINSAGQVGIGTSNASNAKLQVTGSNYNDQLVVERTDTSSKWGIAGYVSGGFQLYDVNSGNATRLAVDSSGRVTMPYQPAFMAYPTGSTGAGNYVSSWVTDGDYGTYQIGNHLTSDRFTAPVAGRYQINVKALYNTAGDAQYARVFIYVNGSQVIDGLGDRIYGGPTVDYYLVAYSVTLNLNANDYVQLKADDYNDNGYIYAGRYTSFSGFLVG